MTPYNAKEIHYEEVTQLVNSGERYISPFSMMAPHCSILLYYFLWLYDKENYICIIQFSV